MSRNALELLRHLGLLEKDNSVADLTRHSPEQLQDVLRYYSESREQSIVREAAEARCPAGRFGALISSVSARNAVLPLLPSAFAFARLFTNDPLFRIGAPPDEQTRVQRQSIGLAPNAPPEHWRVANALNYFSELAPLIEAGIIVVLPFDLLRRPPAQRPIRFSEDWFRSSVPGHLHDFVHTSAIVTALRPSPRGEGIFEVDRSPDTTGRGISISFRGDDTVDQGSLYFMYQPEIVDRIDETHFRFALTLDWDSPPPPDLYRAWVYQSINQAIAGRLGMIGTEMTVADDLGGAYLTESSFEAELCGKSADKNAPAAARTDAVNFLRANTPYLRIDSPETVARVRTENPALFERFQHSLLHVSNELQGVEEGFDDRARQLFEAEVRPQVDEIQGELTKLAGGIGGGVLVAASTIGLAILSGPALPLASVIALGTLAGVGTAAPAAAEYRAAHRGPAYIWSQITK